MATSAAASNLSSVVQDLNNSSTSTTKLVVDGEVTTTTTTTLSSEEKSTTKQQQQQQTTDVMCEIFSGTVGGICLRLTDHAPDSVKVRYQALSADNINCVTQCRHSYPSSNVVFHHQMYFRRQQEMLTPLKVARQMWQREGFWAFYGGIASPICGTAFAVASSFLAFQTSKEFFVNYHKEHQKELFEANRIERAEFEQSIQQKPIWTSAAAGGVSGIVRAFVTTPIDLLKTKVQVHPDKCPSVVSALRQTVASAPTWFTVPRYLLQGFVPMLPLSIVGNAIWFASYEGTLIFFMNQTGAKKVDQLSFYHIVGASSAAGIALWTTIYPLDTVKTIVQKSEQPGSVKFIPTFLDIWRKNPRMLYNGLGITLVRSIPGYAALCLSYEKAKSFYQNTRVAVSINSSTRRNSNNGRGGTAYDV